MDTIDKIYIAGHRGLVGSAVSRRCAALGYPNILTRTREELDLVEQEKVRAFFDQQRPDHVFLAAAKVGGIHANATYPADFIYTNLAIQTGVIDNAYRSGVRRLLFLGSSCIYPRQCPQPMREDHLLTGPLESTNQPYAVAKIAGVVQCESYNRQYGTRFLAVMPTNLYGPNDNYDLENSHVLPALIRKFHLAKLAAKGEWGKIHHDEMCYGPIPSQIMAHLAAIARESGCCVPQPQQELLQNNPAPAVVLWGSGTPLREFLHVDDLADACVFLMNLEDAVFERLCRGGGRSALPLINIGCGVDQTIKALAETVAGLIGYGGEVTWDSTRPDGTPRKCLDISMLEDLGWRPSIPIEEGIRRTYHSYLQGAFF